MQHPVHSRTPDNPYLDLALARNTLRMDGILIQQPELRSSANWGARMGGLVLATGEFATVLEKDLDLPIGWDPDRPLTEPQLGPHVREGWLLAFEMCGVGLGLDERTLAELRKVDEQAFPTEDVGLYSRCKIVWAVKKGR